MSPSGEASLRERLDGLGALPRKTWPALIRLLRARKKRTGEAPFVGGQGDLQRALGMQVSGEDGVAALHEALRGLHVAALDDVRAQEQAARADGLMRALVPTVRSAPVSVSVSGWHPSIPSAVRRRIVGRDLAEPVEPVEAAVLRHELDGLVLGGCALQVSVALDGEVLPAVPRDRRGGPQRRDRDGSWLPHVDAVGRWSASPEAVARRHAQWLAEAGAESVLDAFCGCGADAVACARAGLAVTAWELDPGRAALARRNAAALGVAVEVRVGDGLAAMEAADGTGALFLDPPWGSAEAADLEERSLDWDGLFGGEGERVAARLASWRGPVLLKLPRAFHVESLPGDGWDLRWQLGDGDAERIVKVISALRAGR